MRIFDENSKCNNSKITLNGVKYTLTRMSPDFFQFQVNEPDKVVDAITLTLQELKALFILTSCNDCK
jgi:hypothetical protein